MGKGEVRNMENGGIFLLGVFTKSLGLVVILSFFG